MHKNNMKITPAAVSVPSTGQQLWLKTAFMGEGHILVTIPDFCFTFLCCFCVGVSLSLWCLLLVLSVSFCVFSFHVLFVWVSPSILSPPIPSTCLFFCHKYWMLLYLIISVFVFMSHFDVGVSLHLSLSFWSLVLFLSRQTACVSLSLSSVSVTFCLWFCPSLSWSVFFLSLSGCLSFSLCLSLSDFFHALLVLFMQVTLSLEVEEQGKKRKTKKAQIFICC